MKMTLFAIFITAVLVSSFVASILPYANALTTRTDFSDRHTTASWGNSHVCGDHICKSGEQSEWMMKLSSAQRGGTENLKQLRTYGGMHDTGVMHNLSGSTTSPNNMNGNMNEKMSLGDNNMAGNGTAITGTK
jgi:hypothetical protein